MDCLQLQLQPHQLRTQPFHYLINEQAKSLLALQELQNEVGALLEFRDLVMETFPNLRQKMSSSSSHTFSTSQNYCSNIPVPLSGSLNSRQWEPGIKVKRKIINKSDNENSFGRVRSNSHGSKIHSSQPKSSEAISGVQDSGFSTETNSSNKDHASSTATSVPLPVPSDDPFLTRKESVSHKDSRRCEYDRSDEEMSEDGLGLKTNEAEEELWNLLDVIHTKGTKLREEVETLQLRLVVDEIESHLKQKELEIQKVGKRSARRCRSLENFDGASSLGFNVIDNEPFHFKYHDNSFDEGVFSKKRTRSIELEDIDHIREERNMLLDKLAEMESENVANRIKTSELQNEISALINTKEELQDQLLQAMKQKNELNSRIHELHLKFVTGDYRRGKAGRKPDSGNDMTDLDSSQEISSISRSKSSDDTHKIINVTKNVDNVYRRNSSDADKVHEISVNKELGALDGIISNPKRIKEYCKITKPNKKKLEAILKERNYVELQRHLLVSVVENQALNSQLETSIKSQEDLCEQLDKYKEENDELKFQLEERNIELEGTRAQVRVLERMHQQSRLQNETKQTETLKTGENFTFLENDHLRSKGFSETEINRARQIFLDSQNKKVEKSEVLKVLNRSYKNNNPSLERLDEVHNSFELMGKSSNVIPILALPMPVMTSHQSSGTESTHALEISSELEADMARVDKNESLRNDKSPYRRRPSKIPLNIQKSPKTPAQKSLKVNSANPPPSLKRTSLDASKQPKDTSTTTVTMTFKKCAPAENPQNSMTSHRSPSRNANSIKYNSFGRTNSQASIASQRSHTSSARTEKKKMNGKEDNSLTSNGSVSKNLSLKQTTNFSTIRQRDTLTRKNQNETTENSGKRTLRGTLRDSFRSKTSSNEWSSISSKRDSSLSSMKKDSMQQKQNRTVSPSVQQKSSSNKSILMTDSDMTKFDQVPSSVTPQHLRMRMLKKPDLPPTEEMVQLESESQIVPTRPESETFVDSLNSSTNKPSKTEKPNLFREVRRNFQKKIAEKLTQNLSSYKLLTTSKLFQNLQATTPENPEFDVWNCPKTEGDWNDRNESPVKKEASVGTPGDEIRFFDSIDNSLDIDKDDSLLINSCSYYHEPSVHHEAMAELDSLEFSSTKPDEI